MISIIQRGHPDVAKPQRRGSILGQHCEKNNMYSIYVNVVKSTRKHSIINTYVYWNFHILRGGGVTTIFCQTPEGGIQISQMFGVVAQIWQTPNLPLFFMASISKLWQIHNITVFCLFTTLSTLRQHKQLFLFPGTLRQSRQLFLFPVFPPTLPENP